MEELEDVDTRVARVEVVADEPHQQAPWEHIGLHWHPPLVVEHAHQELLLHLGARWRCREYLQRDQRKEEEEVRLQGRHFAVEQHLVHLVQDVLEQLLLQLLQVPLAGQEVVALPRERLDPAHVPVELCSR